MLGKAEMMISHRDLFAASDLKKRGVPQAAASAPGIPRERARARRAARQRRRARDRAAALELGPHPQAIVSRAGRLTFANLPARALFQISREDIGRPFADLALAHRPVELLEPVDQALRERRRVQLGEDGVRARARRPARLASR